MNFMQEDQKGYCNNNEEEVAGKALGEARNKLPFSSSSSSSSSSFALHQHQNLWLGRFDSQEEYRRQETATNFDNKMEFMDLSSLANNEEPPSGGGGGTGVDTSYRPIEKEHMFDKVVTPSDVGKLNRLVIPKQHAEKYFPLDSSSNEKGLLLNFEDRHGKAWRFRYSYWNSSQSYVMTKGWSRFVKEKNLDAGDVVSFQRGAGESDKDRLYIDWRRRPEVPDPTSLARIQLQNQLRFQQSVRWGRFFSLPHQSHVSINPRSYEHLQSQNYSNIYPYHHHQQQQMLSFGHAGPTQQYYLRSSSGPSQQIGAVQERGNAPLVIDSVPVVHGKAAGKRLRLFGVNMDCPIQDESSSYLPPLQSRVPNNNPPLSAAQAEYNSKKGKSSLSFDLDL